MSRLLISGVSLFAVYLVGMLLGFAKLTNEVFLVVWMVVKWALWIWFIVEVVSFIRKNKKEGGDSSLKSKRTFNKRWLISLIVVVVGTYFAFAIFMGDKPGMSEENIALLVWTTFLTYFTLIMWLFVESIIFLRKNKDALPLSLITAFFSLNILFVLLLQILFNAMGLAVPEFARNGRGYFFLISALIFLGLAVWTVVKGISLIKNKKDVNLGIVSLVVGGITALVSVWFIRGAIYIFTYTPPGVISQIR